MKKILLLSVALLGVMLAWADEVTVDGINYKTGYQNEVQVVQSTVSGDITIPSSVLINGNYWNVKSIGYQAFAHCEELTSITLPDGITSIGEQAFSGCTALTSVNLPKYLQQIGDYAFNACKNLTSALTIPNQIWTIGDYAFSGCESLTSLTFASGGYRNLSIGDHAFLNCKALTSVEIPAQVTQIQEEAFAGCNSLESISVVSTNSVYDSRDSCNAIIETATNTLIAGCKNTSIPNSVTSIGAGAFHYNKGLTSLTIPNGVTSIGERAFEGCENLVSVISNIEEPFAFGIYAFGAGVLTVSSDCVLTVPYGTRDAYIAAGWTTDVFQGGIVEASAPTAVGDQFTAAVPLGSGTVDMTFKVTSTSPLEVKVGTGFGYSPCISKTSSGALTIPSEVNGCTVTGIAYNAFYDCSKITSVSLPATLTTIEWCAFATMTGLKSIAIPEGVTDIPSYVFNGCTALEEIQLPSGLQSIDTSAFTYCQKLTTLTIPAGVTVISESLFRNCSALRSVVLLGNVTSIESNAFSDCNSLAELTVYATVPPSLGNSYSLRTTNVTLYVPAGSKSAYEAADYWKEFKEIIEMEGDEEPVEEIAVTDISQMDNAIYIEPFTARVGDDVQIEVKLKNAEASTSYGFELVLPEGMTIAVNSDNEFDDELTLSSRNSKHSATTNLLANGNYKIGVASMSSKAITDNDGTVLTITAHISEDMAEGDYPIRIASPLLVSTDASKPAIQATQTRVTVEDYMKGDVDGDGVVDLADAVLVINYYVGKAVNTFVAKAADVDGDGTIDLADAVKIINFYVGKVPSLSRRATADGLDPQ